MIKHVVMFKLKEKNEEQLEKLSQDLQSLKGKIEQLVGLEVGKDFMGSERSMDLVLITDFNSKEDLSIYAGHPDHVPVVTYAREICSEIKAVDYEY